MRLVAWCTGQDAFTVAVRNPPEGLGLQSEALGVTRIEVWESDPWDAVPVREIRVYRGAFCVLIRRERTAL